MLFSKLQGIAQTGKIFEETEQPELSEERNAAEDIGMLFKEPFTKKRSVFCD
ncbi:hypothetical protein LI951_00805 [Enterococcus sp. BWT-B8]|uniref:hypothetical protein n=1 Tax=Enterococcus sp. BWT-B8 TaxID=2885157 RepID=UPI001E4BB95D|nr:hypothetical protein [Enterococcus sp. BWT-B8]MCB5950599.1 hypothetical protein [Enterococcus sp. BWT-B8]